MLMANFAIVRTIGVPNTLQFCESSSAPKYTNYEYDLEVQIFQIHSTVGRDVGSDPGQPVDGSRSI